jgi:hypothetical protein
LKSQLFDRLDEFVDGLTDGLTDDLNDEYNQEIYDWYDFEADCNDWYMDNFHLWDGNHFHILFDDSNAPFVENINVPH